MRTDRLVAVLAGHAPAAPPGRERLGFHLKLAGGALLVLAAMLVLLPPRPDLARAAGDAMFWWKLAYPATLGALALVALRRLAHPGLGVGGTPWAIVSAFGAAALGAGVVLATLPAAQRQAAVFGSSWLACVAGISLLAVPAFIAAFWAERRLAPTRAALTGAAAGLFAGACASFAYALHCAEMALPFVALWYSVGMLVPALAGALAGPRLLRW